MILVKLFAHCVLSSKLVLQNVSSLALILWELSSSMNLFLDSRSQLWNCVTNFDQARGTSCALEIPTDKSAEIYAWSLYQSKSATLKYFNLLRRSSGSMNKSTIDIPFRWQQVYLPVRSPQTLPFAINKPWLVRSCNNRWPRGLVLLSQLMRHDTQPGLKNVKFLPICVNMI